MELSERQTTILQYLDRYGDTPVDELADELGVSPQTVRSDVASLGEELANEIGLRVGLGNVVHVQRPDLLPAVAVRYGDSTSLGFAQLARLFLILQSGYVTSQEVSKALYVSHSYADKRLREMARGTSGYIQTERRRGIRYVGTPYERLMLFRDICYPILKSSHADEIIVELDNIDASVLEHFTRRELREGVALARAFCTTSVGRLTGGSYRQLVLCCLFLMWERDHLDLTELEGPFVRMGKDARNAVVTEVVETACEGLLGSLPKEAVALLAGLVLTLRKINDTRETELDTQVEALVSDLLERIGKGFSIDLTGDEELRRGLVSHIRTTVFSDDLLESYLGTFEQQNIMRQYPLAVEMASLAARMIDEAFGHRSTDDEVAFLCLHFQVAIERKGSGRQRIRALVVCHYGQAAANLISEKIARLFPLIEVVGISSLEHFLGCGLYLRPHPRHRAPAGDGNARALRLRLRCARTSS